jgi:hypothetical protein
MRKLSLPSFLRFYSITENGLRIGLLFAIIAVIVFNSTLFEEEYTEKLMNLYVYPWWRFLLVFLVISSAVWSPELGIFIALAVFFYLNDMNTLVQPIASG